MQHKYRVFLVCAIGIFVTVFDTSAAIVILPTIALEFDADLTIAQWVILGNSMTIAALLVPVGRLSDQIGRKLIYVVGCAVFSIGAALAWLAESIQWLIIARCIVGIGSAMTQGTAMAILVANFPAGERARMLGLQMSGVGLGAIAGPALGGIIAGTVGWRMLFAIATLAMAAIGIAGQITLRRRPKRPEGPAFDWLGAILFSSAFVAGLMSLTLGPRFGWTAPATIAGVAAFALISVLFVLVERRHATPMLDFRLFSNPAFSFGAFAAVALFMCMSATRFVTPFFLHGVKGFDPASIGFYMLPAAVVTAIVAPFAGRLADRFGERLFANIGFGVAVVGVVLFSAMSTQTPTLQVVVALMVLAFGMSVFGAPNSAAILNAVPAEQYGIASGFINLCRNSGNVIGIAFGTAIVTLTMSSAGFSPSLTAVSSGAEVELFDAFTRGVRRACYGLMILSIPVFVIVTGWSVRLHLIKRRAHHSSSK